MTKGYSYCETCGLYDTCGFLQSGSVCVLAVAHKKYADKRDAEIVQNFLPKLAITTDDLIAIGVPRGSRSRMIRNKLAYMASQGEVENNKEALLSYVQSSYDMARWTDWVGK